MVIHHKKNYWLYKDATCHNLWPCDFTDVTAFSSVLFSVALLLISLHILPFMAFSLAFFFFYRVLFHGCVVLFQRHLLH